MVLSDEIYDHILYEDAEFVPMATLVARYLVLHHERPVEGVSGLRVSCGLGCFFGRHRKCRRVSCRAGVAELPAAVQ